MVYTLTLNPSLDYYLSVNNICFEKVNRACSAVLRYGGKGINVSAVLGGLGIKNKALGFVAGFSEKGDYNYALRLGTAAGNASAFLPGLATGSEVYEVLKNLP